MVATLLLVGLQAGNAEAKFLSGAARWHSKPAAHQRSYVMGMLRQSMITQLDVNIAGVRSKGSLECSGGKMLDAGRIVKAISAYYVSNPARSAKSPSVVFHKILQRVYPK